MQRRHKLQICGVGVVMGVLLGLMFTEDSDRPEVPHAPPRSDSMDRAGLQRAPDAVLVQRGLGITVLSKSRGTFQPLAGAKVSVVPVADGEALQRESSESGLCHFEEAKPGNWRVTVNAAGHQTKRAAIRWGTDDKAHAVRIVLMAWASLSGTVRTHEGAAAAGARVVLDRQPRAPTAITPIPRTPMRECMADEKGHFSFEEMPPNKPFQLWIRHRKGDYLQVRIEDLAPGEARELAVNLKRMSAIRGRVPKELLSESSVCSVDLLRLRGSTYYHEGKRSPTQARPQFEFSPVLEGQKILTFWVRNGTNYVIGFSEFVAPSGDRHDVGVLSVLPSDLYVQLKPDNLALIGREALLSVQLLNESFARNLLPIYIVIPIGPRVHVQGLPSGRIHITAAVQARDGSGLESNLGSGNSSVEFDGLTKEILIQLRPHGGGKEGGQVQFSAALPQGVKKTETTLNWLLWQDGRLINASARAPCGVTNYRTPVVPAGQYKVEVFGGGLVASMIFQMLPGRREAPIQVRAWKKAETLQGVVVDSEGAEVPRAKVLLLLEEEGAKRTTVDEARADELGRFVFCGLPRCERLAVRAEGGRARSKLHHISGLGVGSDVRLTVEAPDARERK